jgi:ribose 1,5-bisphosphokinase PhnN
MEVDGTVVEGSDVAVASSRAHLPDGTVRIEIIEFSCAMD